ncbi:secretoglobin family 1D member 2-like [Phacochoerus africanus]|uniref:secretoglobin family 1D member 2-like n=1 Tax=Phacochoerus africanus TaxID=41426 RepID=UPI001FD8A5BE|nr:secretoglobin family 1D member 2-like [Phacochoerus africanus]
MRLSLTVLLVTLALCCYEAHGIACPALVNELSGFLWKPDALYRPELELFGAPPEAVEAKMEVKQCANDMSLKTKTLLTKALVEILVKKCGSEETTLKTQFPDFSLELSGSVFK